MTLMASVGSATTPRTASTSIIIELHVPAGMMPGDGARVGRGEKEGFALFELPVLNR